MTITIRAYMCVCAAAVMLLCAGWVQPAVAYPPVQHVDVGAGEPALLMEVDGLPIISVVMTFPSAGWAYDPSGKQGLAELAAAAVMEGAGEYSAKEIAALSDEYAIPLSFSVDADRLVVTFSTLAQYRDKAFALVQALLTKPHFTPEALNKIRSRMQSARKMQQGSPGYVASRAWAEAVYGTHPYAQESLGSDASVAAITVDDLRRYMARLTGDTVQISLVGTVSASKIAPHLAEIVAALPASGQDAALATYRYAPKETQYAPLDVGQTTVLFGFSAVPRAHPDFYAQYVLNDILGGSGFNAVLMERVREQSGLVYSISTSLSLQEKSSLWMGAFATRNDNVDAAIAMVTEVISELAEGQITDAQISEAKQHIIGALPVQTDTNAKLANYLSSVQYYDLGLDYLDKRRDYFQAVTRADIVRVAKQYLQPGDITFAVAGATKGKSHD